MTEVLTAAQMRALEKMAMDSGAVTGLELMERAGRGVVDAIFAEWPHLASVPQRAVVLCGPGNNGGDGFVIARVLQEWGWEVEVYLFGGPGGDLGADLGADPVGDLGKMPPDARRNYDRWCAQGVVHPIEDLDPEIWAGRPIVIDAVFGTGVSRDLPQGLQDVLSAAQACRRVAVDLPSGLNSDSGRVMMNRAHGAGLADLTVSFHRPKLGHYLAEGPQVCGRLVVADIGLPEGGDQIFVRKFGALVRMVGAEPGRLDKTGGHKFDHGHALVLSGPMGRSGAGRLAARAALRVGAGVVTVGAPGSAMMECACQLTAIMLRRCDGPEGLANLLEDQRITALCLGPGLGVERARALLPVLRDSDQRVILDADALSALVDVTEIAFHHLKPTYVLMPHGGEFARLFPDLAEKLALDRSYSKIEATRAAAARAGCTVLFKGHDTVIASPDGRVSLHGASYDRCASWLATAGAGDILAGLITGLVARGFDPHAAAEAAAWLHVEAARAFGPGLIAEDLPELIPSVIGKLAKIC